MMTALRVSALVNSSMCLYGIVCIFVYASLDVFLISIKQDKRHGFYSSANKTTLQKVAESMRTYNHRLVFVTGCLRRKRWTSCITTHICV